MSIELRDINTITPYENNPRVNDQAVEAVAANLREFGWQQPIVVDKGGVIIAGHTRMKAALLNGDTIVPCVVAEDLSPAQVKAYRLADNKSGEIAEWDLPMLDIELNDLMDMDIDMAAFGFELPELNGDDEPSESNNAYDDEFEPDLPEEPTTKRGEIWALGSHRLMCGDSTSQSDVDALMDGEKARCVFTDPPWNVDYGSDARHPFWKPRQIMNDHMSTDQFGAFLLAAFASMKRVSVPGCMTYIVMSAQEWGNLMNALTELDYHWSSTVIWNKDRLVLSRKDYHTKYEPIWYGWLNGAPRICPLDDRKQTDVWDFERPKVSEEHPTMKPVPLVARAIYNSSQAGRSCRMMELDPKYCDVIINRWEQLTGENAVRL